MATITKLGIPDPSNQLGASPYGNVTAFRYVLTTNASGAVIGGDSTAAVASGDVVKIGLIPEGFRLIDSLVVIKTAMSASVTGNLGFAYSDGVDSTAVPQSATFFGSALALSSAARLRNATTNLSVTLPKEAWLTLTTGGANNAKASEIGIIVFAINEGVV